MNRMLTALAMAAALSQAVSGADNPTIKPGHTMKIRLRIEDKVITATLAENKPARDFSSLLPLTFTMNDLFG